MVQFYFILLFSPVQWNEVNEFFYPLTLSVRTDKVIVLFFLGAGGCNENRGIIIVFL